MPARASRNSRLALYLAAAYTLLVLYASLHPFAGWRDSGADPLAFLAAAWPRYFTAFDLVVNTLAYLPLGLLWGAALLAWLPRSLVFLLVVLLGSGLSLGVELTQNFLPSRVPSNLDLACNTLGVVLGALGALHWGHALIDGGRLHAWRERRFLRGRNGDIGLLLLALWFLTQLNPETFLFGTGNLRSLLGVAAPLPFEAGRFGEFEMATVAAHTLAIALIGSHLAANHPVLLPLALIAAGLAIKSFALMLLIESLHGFAWATPGTLGGLALGLGLWGALFALQRSSRVAIAALALMLAVVLANLMPDNPYLEHTLRVWQQGHFLNFNGLTRTLSSLWPFLALPWLMLSRNPHGHRH